MLFPLQQQAPLSPPVSLTRAAAHIHSTPRFISGAADLPLSHGDVAATLPQMVFLQLRAGTTFPFSNSATKTQSDKGVAKSFQLPSGSKPAVTRAGTEALRSSRLMMFFFYIITPFTAHSRSAANPPARHCRKLSKGGPCARISQRELWEEERGRGQKQPGLLK